MNDMIRFPNLGITLSHVGSVLRIGNFEIAYYGIIVALGMLAGIHISTWIAKKTKQDPDLYFYFAFVGIFFSVIGARIYYCLFRWDYYRDNPAEILNLRGGGLAIYGGVIGGVLSCLIYSRIRKKNTLLMMDTACIGLITGQMIGRWGNFFNREAFGGYTDNLLAMQIPVSVLYPDTVTAEMLEHQTMIDGEAFVQVHPTFLYESAWNLVLLVLLILITVKGWKRFHGQVFLLYMIGYGLGRFWVEGLRTDQLLWPKTQIAVSQVLAAAVVCVCVPVYMILYLRSKKKMQTIREA